MRSRTAPLTSAAPISADSLSPESRDLLLNRAPLPTPGSVPIVESVPSRDRKGVTVALRAAKADEDEVPVVGQAPRPAAEPQLGAGALRPAGSAGDLVAGDPANRGDNGASTTQHDAVFIIADGLSALAVQRHAPNLLEATLRLLPPDDWNLAPIVIVEQGRVAIGDEIGQCLGAALAVVLIGERPGLSSADSLGVYLTWNPHPGLTDADRNCISNIRQEGLTYPAAAGKLLFLMTESRRRKLSGVHLKEDFAGLTKAESQSGLHTPSPRTETTRIP